MDTQPEREQAVKRAQRTGIKALFDAADSFLGVIRFCKYHFFIKYCDDLFSFLFAGGSRRKCQHESGGKHFYLLFERSRKLSACHFHAFIRSADRPNGQKEKIHRPVYDDLCFMHHFNGGFCRGFVSEGHIRASAILDPCRHHVCDRKVFLSFKLGVL